MSMGWIRMNSECARRGAPLRHGTMVRGPETRGDGEQSMERSGGGVRLAIFRRVYRLGRRMMWSEAAKLGPVKR